MRACNRPRVLRPLILAAGALLLAGCVSTVPFPAQWARPVPAQADCAHLTGVYENRGMRVESDWMIGSKPAVKPATLSSLLFAGRGEVSARAIRLRLDLSDPARMVVQAIYPDGAVNEAVWVRDKGEFGCRDGSIVISAGQFGAAWVALLGFRETHRLSRASDGALILDEHAWGVGTAMVVVPIGFSGRSYARFPAAAEAPSAAPASPQ